MLIDGFNLECPEENAELSYKLLREAGNPVDRFQSYDEVIFRLFKRDPKTLLLGFTPNRITKHAHMREAAVIAIAGSLLPWARPLQCLVDSMANPVPNPRVNTLRRWRLPGFPAHRLETHFLRHVVMRRTDFLTSRPLLWERDLQWWMDAMRDATELGMRAGTMFLSNCNESTALIFWHSRKTIDRALADVTEASRIAPARRRIVIAAPGLVTNYHDY